MVAIVAAGEEKGGRRSIYLLVRRSIPVSFLNAFDAPVMETNCTRRQTSTTVTQTLALMNSAFLHAQSRQFARRVLKEQSASETETLNLVYQLAYARLPKMKERSAALGFIHEQTALYEKAGQKPEQAKESALADLCQALFSANEFVYLD